MRAACAALFGMMAAACSAPAETAPPSVSQSEERALAEARAMIPAEERAVPR